MKIWEVMKELKNDPTQVFTDGHGNCLKYTDDGLLAWHRLTGEICGLYTFNRNDNTDFNIADQPIPWQEAIQEFAKGKKLIVKFNNHEWDFGALVELPEYLDRAIKNGKWYVGGSNNGY